jgi:membrane associated rhomboid family serine protease
VIPLRDDNPTLLTPVITIAIIILNVAVWIYLQGGGMSEQVLAGSVCQLGTIPAELTGRTGGYDGFEFPGSVPCEFGGLTWFTILTSMFLHGSWLHLIGNMWFLGIFGRNVECALDHGRFLVFYLACGVAGGLAHVFSDMHSVIPCLGASGAISGIMGAYVSIFPFNKIRLWFGWMLGVVELPAIAVLGFWFLFQYLAAFMELESGVSDGTAYWDHLGGFVAGVAGIWGTIFYLKYQLANAPETAADQDGDLVASATEPADLDSAGAGERDAFGGCMPPPRSGGFDEPRSNLPDPFQRIFDERENRFTPDQKA